ncbi:MAG: FtsX-like permease family protein [Bifidobacterium animalis]|nr:FtsX-like permease family protein [Bifidobacterium animalis]MDY5040437.1 FtsX-like permease family protein [Bifidobacterium animalis]
MADNTRHAGAMPARSANRRMFWKMVVFAAVRKRSRAIMAVIASLIGSATLLCLAIICLVVPAQMDAEMRSYGANLVVTAPNGFDDATVRTVTRSVEQAGAARSAAYRYESVRINAAPYTMAGIEPQSVRAINRHWTVEGDWPGSGSVMLGRDAAQALGVKVGSTVTIGLRSDDSDRTLRNGRRSTDILDDRGVRMRVSGILDTGGAEDGLVYMETGELTGFAGKRGPDVLEFASDAQPDRLTALTGELRRTGENTATTYDARQVTRMTSSNQRIVTMLRMLFWIVSVVALALTLMGVSTTMASIVTHRRAEIGLRRALGSSAREIAGEFLVESALYGLIGGLLGTGIGYGIAVMLCERVFGRHIGFDWWLAFGCVVVAMVLAVLASLGPVRRATSIDPAVVLREE